jgi:hypothetical protein
MRRTLAGCWWSCVLLCTAAPTNAYAFPPLLPDAKLTPGKVARGARDSRGVTPAMEEAVFKRYRIAAEHRDYYVIDHLIPTELGGADAVQNLWPQRLDARPYGPHRKQVITRKLLELIAANRITISQAQREISEDWISAFVVHIGMVHLTPELKESRE